MKKNTTSNKTRTVVSRSVAATTIVLLSSIGIAENIQPSEAGFIVGQQARVSGTSYWWFPIGATTAAKNSLLMYWTEVKDTTSYQVEYSTSSNFSSSKVLTVTGAKQINVTGLAANTTYYWRVKSLQHVSAEWSNTVTAKTTA